jgi:tripartite-type tricarboxylate transporter receptor subunit TctC
MFMAKKLLALLATVVLGQFLEPRQSFADSPFYQGKTITIVQSTEPGGSADLRTRAVTAGLTPAIPTIISAMAQ